MPRKKVHIDINSVALPFDQTFAFGSAHWHMLYRFCGPETVELAWPVYDI